MAKVLIIEDEPGVQITLEDRLAAEGHTVTIKGNGLEGEAEASAGRYELILLDVMLPGKDGFTICRDLRKAGINTPILMLTARDTNIDTIMGLRVGADDYLPKPFDMQVLLARIEALLRRSAFPVFSEGHEPAGSKPDFIIFGEYRLDLIGGQLEHHVPGRSNVIVDLNAQEYKLLEYLAVHSGRIISRNTILDDVWGYESEVTTRTVDVHIAKLRGRLGESEKPRHIQTYRGRGYKFILNP